MEDEILPREVYNMPVDIQNRNNAGQASAVCMNLIMFGFGYMWRYQDAQNVSNKIEITLSVPLNFPLSVLSFCPCFQYCPDNISCTAQPFSTKLGMVVYYHEVECHAEKLVYYLQCQGHSEGLYNQNMTISTTSSKPLVCLQANLV